MLSLTISSSFSLSQFDRDLAIVVEIHTSSIVVEFTNGERMTIGKEWAELSPAEKADLARGSLEAAWAPKAGSPASGFLTLARS